MKKPVKIALEVVGAVTIVTVAAFAAYLLTPDTPSRVHKGSRAKERQALNQQEEEIIGI